MVAISDPDVHSDTKDFDLSRTEHYESGAWRQIFARMRAETPIHFCPENMFGPYWSVVRYAHMVEVEGNPEIFSSSWEHGGISIFDAHTTNVKLPMFFAVDEPEHSLHRKTLAPAVTPSVMQKLIGPLRQRTASVLDFPWKDRHLLPFWADWMASVDIAVDPAMNAEPERHAFEMAAYFKRLFDT